MTRLTDDIWSVPSASEPGVDRIVTLSLRAGVVACTCPARRWDCRHVKAVVVELVARSEIEIRDGLLVRPVSSSEPVDDAFAGLPR